MISVVPQNSLKINEKYQHFDADKAFEGLLPFRGTQVRNDKPPREPKGCRCGDVLCGIATPLYLSLSLIIQEGLPLNELDLIIRSTKASTEEAEVIIITGDTKVVN